MAAHSGNNEGLCSVSTKEIDHRADDLSEVGNAAASDSHCHTHARMNLRSKRFAVKTLAKDGSNIERPRRWIALREMKHLRQAWIHGGNDTRDTALLEANPLRVVFCSADHFVTEGPRSRMETVILCFGTPIMANGPQTQHRSHEKYAATCPISVGPGNRSLF